MCVCWYTVCVRVCIFEPFTNEAVLFPRAVKLKIFCPVKKEKNKDFYYFKIINLHHYIFLISIFFFFENFKVS